MKNYIFFILIVLFFSSCDPSDCRIKFINKSNKTLYVENVIYSPISDFEQWFLNKEKSFKIHGWNFNDRDMRTIPHETRCFHIIDNWEVVLKDTTKYIYIYALNLDYLNHRDTVNIKNYLDAYKINLNDIKKNNWQFKYPLPEYYKIRVN